MVSQLLLLPLLKTTASFRQVAVKRKFDLPITRAAAWRILCLPAPVVNTFASISLYKLPSGSLSPAS